MSQHNENASKHLTRKVNCCKTTPFNVDAGVEVKSEMDSHNMLPHTHNAPQGQLSSSDDGHTIPYDTRCYFNDMSRLNLPHRNDNWNSLPVALRSSDVTEETFRRHLKTFLFNCLDN